MLLPPLREKGDVGEQVDRGLEDIERVIAAKIVKAVLRVAALNVAAIALPHGIQPTLMPVTGNAVFIESDEHGVVVFLCPVPGSFTALVDELPAHEGIEYLTVDATLLQQVGIHTAHGLTLRWECEGLCRLRLLLLCRRVTSAQIVTKEQLILKVWGYDSDAEDNNVEVYISFLRKKLDYLHSKVKIRTIRMVGYRLEQET